MTKIILLGIMFIALSPQVFAQSATILPSSSTFSKNTGDFTNGSTAAGAFSLRATITSASPGSLSSAIRGANNSTTANGMGIWGSHNGAGYGVYGTTLTGIGLYGVSTSSGLGVLGVSVTGVGVQGSSTDDVGIRGYSNNNVPGIFEINNNANGNSALIGTTNSNISGISAINGIISSTTPGGFSAGVKGTNKGTGGLGIGVWGSHDGGGWGVYGLTPSGIGVYGNSTSGIGIYGNSSSGVGIQANSASGVGTRSSSNTNIAGVFEITNPANENPALIGQTNSTVSNISAINGIISSTSPGGFSSAVRGSNKGTGGLGIGVWGSQDGSGWGVYGVTPNGIGVYGNSSAGGYGVFANSNTGTGLQGTSNNGKAATFDIFNNANANTVLTTSTVGDGTVVQISKSNGSGNGAGLSIQKSSPFSGAYTSDAHAELEIRHPSLSTAGMTGLRILNTDAGLNSWTLYTSGADGSLALYAKNNYRGSFNATTGAYTNVSDARLKHNLKTYKSTLGMLMKVGVKSYQLLSSDKTEIGLLAQEVMQYFPEIIYNNTDEKGRQFYTMDYARIGVLAVKAIQEQQKEIDELRKEIAELRAYIKK